MVRTLGVALLGIGAIACGSPHGAGDETPPNGVCSDPDGDGRGVGAACRGPDCDESDPLLWEAEDCKTLCVEDAAATGCPCDWPSKPELCYAGEAATLGVGTCRPGIRHCLEDDTWSPCEHQVLPSDERCDGLDEDCDGAADDGCEEDRCDGVRPCEVAEVPSDGWTEENATGLEVDGTDLVLGEAETAAGHAWIANTRDTTVSKIDTTELVELARYPSVVEFEAGVFALDEPCGNLSRGNCPSRTAVAQNGDAFVANRGFAGQSTLTKFAGDIERCEDRDEDGAVETSVDLDGDGRISTDPAAGEYMGIDDECVLWTVPVGELGGVARALAIASPLEAGATGEVFVGLHDHMRAVVVDPDTGETVDELVLDVHPYGAVLDPDGRIWFSEGWAGVSGNIQAVDADDHDVEPVVSQEGLDCNGSYGITVDESGRIWLGSYPCNGVIRYDPSEDEWTHFPLEGAGQSLGLTPDGRGGIWVGFWRDALGRAVDSLLRIDADSGEIDLSIDIDPSIDDARGVGMDEEGQVWVVGRLSENVVQVDPDTEEVVAVPVGVEPYSYSDFTGFVLNHVVQPTGSYEHVFEGCDTPITAWYDLVVEADVPEGAFVEAEYRGAATIPGLGAAAWRGPLPPPVDLRAETDRYLEVRIWLRSGRGRSTPRLHGFSVAFSCGGVIG